VFSVSSEERRVVTVLFADVVGFTALAEHRDPEQVKRLVESAFARLTDDITRFGGRVDKILGDAVIALFGAPVAHEDDAERAVRSGLRMHDTLERFARDVPGLGEVKLRIGINTGEVLVGTLTGSDYTAMGDVVNTAARLQSLAPPGGVLVGDATRELCSDALVFDDAEIAQLRGRERSEQVWLATGIVETGTRRKRSSVGRMVGRSVERDLLRSVTELVRTGRSGLVSVTGEAGIGKSRLVDESLAEFRASTPEAIVLEGACSPYGDANVWAPISTGVASHYGLERGRTADEIRRLATENSETIFGVSPDTPGAHQELEALLHLLGHPSELDRLDPVGARDVLFGTVIAGLRRRAERGPIVVWIDDLHWAHALLVDLLQVIARSMVGLPVLIVTASRPVDDASLVAEGWPTVVDRGMTFQLPLEPLGEGESFELVDEITAAATSTELRQRIVERSGGNPLFLTELALLSLESTAAVNAAGDDELPGTLRALIAARLDQLPPDARTVIDNAAIVGSEGPMSALEEFARQMRQTFDLSMVDALAAGGLLELDDSWWRFRSDVVREVAYQTLTKQARAQRHAGVARVMELSSDVPIDKLAHHMAAAAELQMELGSVPGVDPSVRPRAIELLARAAQRSYDMGGYRHGVHYVRRALAMTPDDAENRRPLLLLLADGLVEMRALDEARAELDDVFSMSSASADRVSEGEALRLLGTVFQLEGDLVTAREQLGRAVEIFREIDDPPRLALALRSRGFAEVLGGSLQDAEWYLGEADGLYAALSDDRGRAWVAQHRSWVSFLAGDNAEAEQRLIHAISTFEQLGDHSGAAWSRGLLAFVMYFQRRFAAADQLADEVLEEARQWGDEWAASMMYTLLANLRLWTGRFAEAVGFADKALAGFRSTGDRFGMLQAMAPLNRARVALGRTSDAERGLEEILAVSDSFGGLAFPTIATSGVAMHLGQGRRSVELAMQAIDRMAVTGSNIDEARIQLSLGHLQVGDADEALAALEGTDVSSSPFALGVRSLVLAAIGDLDAAIRDADATTALTNPSYFDAGLAAASAAAASARLGAPDRADRLEHAVASASTSDDVVLSGFLRAVVERLEPAPGRGSLVDVRIPAGWRCVADLITGTVG
jgi:class 3 adenylate cyclase/tetratricopeptide (TPR) repeat protein